MKKMFLLIFALILSASCMFSCENSKSGLWNTLSELEPQEPEKVCCQEIYLETIDPDNMTVEFDYISLFHEECSSNDFVIRKTVDSYLCE